MGSCQNAWPAVNQENLTFTGCVWWTEIYKVMVILGLSLEAFGLLLPWGSRIDVCLFPSSRSPANRGPDKAEKTSLKSAAHAAPSPVLPPTVPASLLKSSWEVMGTKRPQRLTPNRRHLLLQLYVNLCVYLELAFQNKLKWVLRTRNKSIKEGNYSVCFVLLGLSVSDCKE